jgi:DNA-binding transcriptional MerR regulator
MPISQLSIPDKPAFRPEEVVRLTHLDGRVLNFWATEFEGITPARSPGGDLFYSKASLKRILQIKQWLVEERLDKATIRRRLQEGEPPAPLTTPETAPDAGSSRASTLSQIKQGLKEILTILDRGGRI